MAQDQFSQSDMLANGLRLDCNYSLMEAIGFLIIWLVITIITFGIGSFFAIYYFYKTILNKTYVVDRSGTEVGRLNCDLNLSEIIGHIFVWILITIVTLGIGLVFYAFRTFRMCLNRTNIVPT